ncbi:hypothetical protein BDR06DRAFT_966948 [Suillus hirtellus]|nr:hypothetical protein BDR06DRAFT_966948 [Suillus hirtellus]
MYTNIYYEYEHLIPDAPELMQTSIATENNGHLAGLVEATSNPIDPHVSSQASEVATCKAAASNIMLSPLHESIPESDIDSNFDNLDPDNVDHISIPGPSASKGEILEVLKCIPDAHANEIKKLCGVAGDIFNLPSKYFTNINFKRAAIPKIQQLLRVTSVTDLAYRIFLPILFPGLKDDKLLKTVFGNWELLAQVRVAAVHTNSLKWSVHQVTPGLIAWAAVIAIFLISPDTKFSSTGIGKKSNINYKDLFFHYKKILVTKWTMKHIIAIVTNINQYIFKVVKASALKCAERKDDTDVIDRVLAALNMDSDLGNESDASVQIATALEAADPVNGPDTINLEIQMQRLVLPNYIKFKCLLDIYANHCDDSENI